MLEERNADITDMNFINNLILDGAKKGHYSIDIKNQGIVKCMKKEIISVIKCQSLDDGRHAQATIYSLCNKRIAMTILSEASPGISCYELYAMSVISGHQGKGYGAEILDRVLNRFLYLDICARCLPATNKMMHMLINRGFKFHSKNKDCMLMLRTAMDNREFIESGYRRYSIRQPI